MNNRTIKQSNNRTAKFLAKLRIALGLATLSFLFLFGFSSKTGVNVGVKPVAADETSVWAASMQGAVTDNNPNNCSNCHRVVWGDCARCRDNRFTRRNDGGIPGGKRLQSCKDEQTDYAYGVIWGLDSSITYTAHVEVRAGDTVLGRGSGKSKRRAETEAARVALERLSTNFTQ